MRLTMSILLGLSLVACRDTGKGGDDEPAPDGPAGALTVKDVQSDAMAPGTAVSLKGVIVTAIDTFGNRTGDFYVQDLAGGEYSGVKVFGAPLAQVAALNVGDLVNIANAEKEEFALMEDTSGRTVTELKPARGGMMSVTAVGTGDLPTPPTVDALAIGMLPTAAARDAEWEKWEGVPITVVNARQLSPIRTFGSNPGPDSSEFRITGDARVQSALAALPESAMTADCYASITGIGDYFFNWLVHPRETADLVGNGATCAAEEMGEAQCSDGIDNDGDGFVDCADFSCRGSASCVSTTTIAQIQTGQVTGPVTLEGVYVVALSFNRKNAWIATSLTAAPNEGLYLFQGNAQETPAFAADVVVGAKVNVSGVAVEANNNAIGDTLTRINTPAITVVAAPTGDPPVPVTGLQASALVVAATGEPYESVLVTLENVKVTVPGTNASFYVGELAQAGTAFLSDDDIFRLLDPVDTCYATITGIWTYNIFEDRYGLLPISTTPNGTCL